MKRFQIAEWFGKRFTNLTSAEYKLLALASLGKATAPRCPFQKGRPPCGKKGGVCSMRRGEEEPVIMCPERFQEGNIVPRWLARILEYPEFHVAKEVPFMKSPDTGRAAGRIDLVVSIDEQASRWVGLEIQAVYFSGKGMQDDFQVLAETGEMPEPLHLRRPDWRSSSAKRLMPQLQIKGPTLRLWGTKLAVSVDRPFFNAIGGPSPEPSHDLDEGSIIWLIPRLDRNFQLVEDHWEILSLEESIDKLQHAETVKRNEFEDALRAKIKPDKERP